MTPSIIVPVFNGHAELRRCLDSLERHTPREARIVLVNDASTDPRIAPLLADFARRNAHATVLTNPVNQGFVGAANRAFGAVQGDVVVLNSDTEVTAGWIEGLARCMASDPAIGIVCPLSNNATILSLPTVAALYAIEDERIDVDAIGECVRAVSERSYPRIPTAVGFCMLVSHRVLSACGHFDPVYGRGYGEECDLSMRALDRGFVIACCDDVYVHHAGEASFGTIEATGEARRRNAAVLDRRWPMYSPGVAAWGRSNPLRRMIERVTAAAERERLPGRLRVLQVLHRLATRGGIEEHVRSLVNELKGDVAFTIVIPDREGGAWSDVLEERPVAHLRILRLNPDLATPGVEVIGHRAQPADEGVEAAFRQLLAGGYDVVHFQSLVGWNTLRLPGIARASGARVAITAHDFSLQCADYNMMLGSELQPCGRGAARAADAACVPCLRSKSRILDARHGPPSISAFIEARFGAALDAVRAADAIVCPSAYAAERVARAFGEEGRTRTRIIAHGVRGYDPLPRLPREGPLRVTCLGSFSARKGALALIEAAKRIAQQGIAIEAWGPVEPGIGPGASAAGIALRGPYDAAHLPEVLGETDLVIVPSLMEESFCLVASEAQRLGVPVAASERGAIPERVREGDTGFLFPPGDVDAIVALLCRLRDDRRPLEAVAERLRTRRPRTMAESAADHLGMYRELAAQAVPTPAGACTAPNAERVRTCLGLPRERRRTPLGTDEYDAWIAADAGETAPAQRAKPGRIRVVMLPAEISEQAIRRVNEQITDSGVDWVVLLEPGDALAPGAMEAFLQAAEAHPEAALIYASEDAMSLAGERYDPVLKPGFDLALLAHRPYIAGACAVHRERLVARNGLRATGWMGVLDLALNLAKEGHQSAVVCIPELLVHRLDCNARVLEDATWLQAYRERAAMIAQLAPARPSASAVSVLVRCHGEPGRAVACIEALYEATPCVGEIFVDLDAAGCSSVERELEARGRTAGLVPVAPDTALALAVRGSDTEWLAMIDARCGPFVPEWLERIDAALADPKVGALAPDLGGPSGTGIAGWEILGGGPWSVAGEPPPAFRESRLAVLYQSPRAVSALADRLVLVRREAAERSGVLDELGAAGCFAYTHLGLAMQDAGFELRSDPGIAAVWHGAPAALARPPEAGWMRARWGARLERDPHFHPDLARTGVAFGVAPRFLRRADTSDARTRICAFPFDRWGSGTLRVRQPCEALERAGLADVLIMSDHEAGSVPNRLEWKDLGADTFFAHNFLHEYQLQALEEYARESHALRVLGLDDLLSDLPPGNPYAATIYRDIGERIRRAVALCDRLVVTTEPLADAYAPGAKEVCIIANAIDATRWGTLASEARDGPRPRVGWAGARQHLNDLRLLEPVMQATWREIDWVFLGMCPPELRPMAAEAHPMVPIAQYPARLASLGLDVAVAPLVDHPFNRAKSNLKALEYGAVGLPVVASDLPPYRGMPVTRVANGAAAWIDALRHLVADRQRAREAGRELRSWVLAHAMLDANMPAWSRALGVASSRSSKQ